MTTLTEPQHPDPGQAVAVPGPCRLCGDVAYAGDDAGPVHACCYEWRAVIAAGFACPSCEAARQSRRRNRQARLMPLPRALPDGRRMVPGLEPAGANVVPLASVYRR